jgi:hypothetical protein
MKNSIKILAAIAILGFAGNASAQINVATATASATVVAPIAVTTSGSLQFGNIVGGNNVAATMTNNGGTYATSAYSNASINPGSAGNAGTISLPTFNVTGEGNFTFAIVQSAVSGIGGGLTVTLPANTSGTLAGGTASFGVAGATLNVPAAAVAGSYSGGWTETVNYN